MLRSKKYLLNTPIQNVLTVGKICLKDSKKRKRMSLHSIVPQSSWRKYFVQNLNIEELKELVIAHT